MRFHDVFHSLQLRHICTRTVTLLSLKDMTFEPFWVPDLYFACADLKKSQVVTLNQRLLPREVGTYRQNLASAWYAVAKAFSLNSVAWTFCTQRKYGKMASRRIILTGSSATRD